tara:strand:- start:5959 stop:7323 length:1365 start_codon:yes stop_codon:yes gene_type:complete
MMTPYVNYREITSKQDLEDYIKEIDNGLLIYGAPKHIPSPINKEDALMVVFDEKGKHVKLKYKYYITPEGDKYRLNNKNEKIFIKNNKGSHYGLLLETDKTKNFQVHHLQLMSYYPNLNWKYFCQNIQNNGGNNDATVDHIKQEHKICHYKYLEAVPQSENSRRNCLFADKDKILRQAQSKGKPFTMTIDGKQIDTEFYSIPKAVEYLSKMYNIIINVGSIGQCLNINRGATTAYNERLTFKYTDAYLNSQKDLPDEVWKTLDECFQKDAIICKYKNVKRGNPPLAISNKGRIKNGYGKISYGIIKPGRHISTYNNVGVHVLVWLAFSNTKIEDKLLLHDDKHESNTFNENGKVTRYSNYFETLRLGTQQENMKDRSREMQRVAELNPENEFIVRNKEGKFVMKSFYIHDCLSRLKEEYPEIKFDDKGIYNSLKKNYKHQGFTFNYVIKCPHHR